MITVIIPYYQRQAGILRRSLQSIFAQRGVEQVSVVVVDDESPIAAAAEIAALGAVPRFPVQIIRQANAGPGAARNKALDNLPPATRYVAFLDSDDEWSDDHLAHAVFALGQGHDVYFADLLHLDATVSAFSRRQRLQLDAHPPLDGQAVLHTYRGDMFDQIMTGNVIGTSTVVYAVSEFATVRFKPALRAAGEDYLFWMELATRGARFAFSTAIEARYGSGVNVYSGAGWGTDGHALRIHNEMTYRKLTSELFAVDAAQRRFLQVKIRELRAAFVLDLLHRLRGRQRLPWPVIRAQFASDPATAIAIGPALVKALAQAVKRKR